MSLTKAQIIDAIAVQNGFPNKQSSEIVETLLELIKSSLDSGEDVLISGFGKFCVKEKNRRKGRNTATGKDLMLPPRRVVKFKWSRKLREEMNKGI
jgi:integration host factor subunit alpha